MNRNEIKKATAIDNWYKLYTKKSGKRVHKHDKKQSVRKLRRIKKRECNLEK